MRAICGNRIVTTPVWITAQRHSNAEQCQSSSPAVTVKKVKQARNEPDANRSNQFRAAICPIAPAWTARTVLRRKPRICSAASKSRNTTVETSTVPTVNCASAASRASCRPITLLRTWPASNRAKARLGPPSRVSAVAADLAPRDLNHGQRAGMATRQATEVANSQRRDHDAQSPHGPIRTRRLRAQDTPM
jgi:hypothetical protein